jgi:GNAT superfamily N-acetyltransferase
MNANAADPPEAMRGAGDPGGAEIVRLRDRSSVTVRPANPRDEPALEAFLSELCLEARRLRFFSEGADMTLAAHLVAAAGAGRFGLVVHDEAGLLVGHAVCIQMDDARAEVAVEVADRMHGLGLGTILIERLAAVAEQRGVTRFVAEVLQDNRAMLDVFRDGFDAELSFRDGADTVEFPTASWRLARARFDED